MKPASSAQAAQSPLSEVNPKGVAASKTDTATTGDPSDADLVQQIQTGNERAFRILFERYQRRVFAVAFGVVKNQQDAMDVVQEAFLKVHRHVGGFQGTSGFYTWLYRIVMNLSIDHVRKARTSTKAPLDENRQPIEGNDLWHPQLDANPGRNAVRRELAGKLALALETLPEHHQAVIVLREVDGMSYEDMAQVLDVPKGTIMSRLFHARRKMQEALHEYLDGDLDLEDGP